MCYRWREVGDLHVVAACEGGEHDVLAKVANVVFRRAWVILVVIRPQRDVCRRRGETHQAIVWTEEEQRIGLGLRRMGKPRCAHFVLSLMPLVSA